MRSLLYFVVALVITGCSYSGNGSKALDEAQTLIQNDPQKALSRLNAMDITEFEDSATMARWALLYSEAMAVNHLTVPTDTIVNIAVDYYGNHNQPDEFQRASNLKALICSSGENDALASALYLQKEKEFFLYKERVRRGQIMWGAGFALLVAAGIIIWMRQRMKLQRVQNDMLMAEASGLRSQIDTDRGDIGRLESKLRGLLDNRFSLIDSLCQTYYETQGTKAERKAIVEKVKDEIESVKSESFSEMERTVNDCRDGLLDKVKDSYPDIRPADYQLLVYLACGLSPRTVSLLLGESVDVIYKRKSRLKSRLKDSVAPSIPSVMSIF